MVKEAALPKIEEAYQLRELFLYIPEIPKIGIIKVNN